MPQIAPILFNTRCSQSTRNGQEAMFNGMKQSPFISVSGLLLWACCHVQCDDKFLQQSGSPGIAGTLKSLTTGSLICEQGLSVGIYESPRQFNQQPQFASTVYAPKMCVPNWQQSQGLSSALWSDHAHFQCMNLIQSTFLLKLYVWTVSM